MDPLRGMFGVDALSLFRSGEFTVVHGAVDRLPPFMTQGPLASIEALCRSYRGPTEIAHGGRGAGVGADGFIGAGGQTAVSGASPMALLRLGLTVYFADLRGSVPECAAFVRDLEAALGVPPCSAIGAFANAPGSGLGVHHDSHDQLFFQLLGEKSFEVVRAFSTPVSLAMAGVAQPVTTPTPYPGKSKARATGARRPGCLGRPAWPARAA